MGEDVSVDEKRAHLLSLSSGLELGLPGGLVCPALLEERLGDRDLLQ